ncbi:MAG: hypothetical protein EB127_00875 [Alphaproteobacteria bacterium]|nr:hypothetical protein [Alphaproteobacteria bacterium]
MVGNMPKSNPDKDRLFNLSLDMLQDIYDIAKMKQDTETMTAVSDRVCMLYEKQVDIELDRKTPPGFIVKEDDDE